MSLWLSLLVVVAASIVSNRLIAIAVALWLQIPTPLFLAICILIDLVQIPLYFWAYEHSAQLLQKLPPAARNWFNRDWTSGTFGKWVNRFGGPGAALVAFVPTLGGGMWSAIFLAYSLRLPRRASVFWISLGSIFSFLMIYWILSPLVATVRFLIESL